MNIQYTIHGTAAREQTWECTGVISDCDWSDHNLMIRAMTDAFYQLTDGKAVFGKPGVGCQGPYELSRVELILVS